MIRSTIASIALIIGVWLLFDGARALATGNYTTPQSGAHAGQLGPWSNLLSATGINPLGIGVKLLHVALGLSWVLCGVWFLRSTGSGWWPLMLTALLSLWYLPFGTVAALIVGGMLLVPSIRHAA
jgi:hypothetical protein